MEETGEEFHDVSEPKSLEEALRLKEEGNSSFRAGEPLTALSLYQRALAVLPEDPEDSRCAETAAILLCNQAACELATQQYDATVESCTKALEKKTGLPKAYLRRSKAFELLEKFADAFEDLKKYMELCPEDKSLAKHLVELEKKKQEQFERQKTEVWGQLKDLGNTILGKFGMSLDNFQAVQDPNTGSYSIQYKS